MALSEDTHLAFPTPTSHLTDVVFGGVGMRRTTFVPVNLGSKLALRLTVYSTRDLPISSTIGCTLKGRLTLDVERYLMGGRETSEQCDAILKLLALRARTSSTQIPHREA